MAVAVFLALHAGIMLLPADPRGLLSNIFMGLAAGAAVLACGWRYLRSRGPAKTRWGLLSLGLAFWCIGQLTVTYLEDFQHLFQTAAQFPDFYFFIYGIPILLSMASANKEEHSTLLLVIDSFQALLAILLASQVLFFRSLTIQHPEPVSTLTLAYVYNIENIVLVIAAALRVFADPSGEEAEFSRKACLFLSVYAALSAGLNYLDIVKHLRTGAAVDLLWTIPFLLLTVIVLPPFCKAGRGKDRYPSSSPRSSTALIIWNASPTLFTMAVLVQSAFLIRQHLLFGIAALMLALLFYTMRTAVFQTQLMQAEAAHSVSEDQLRRANDQLHKISVADPLTGVANRRRFEEIAQVEWNRAMRFGWPLTLLMIDVDFFKALNDRYGHARGDECLIQVAASLGASLRRGGEMLARYGGEEFVALLPNTRLEEGTQIAEMMRCAVTSLEIHSANTAASEFLSVSIGLASTVPSARQGLNDLLAAADAALYRAKARGRNRTEAFDGDGSEETPGKTSAAFLDGALIQAEGTLFQGIES
ncbi:MAG: GGDEF domain-containing protein [Acidobacteriaceae bacterium]